MSGTGLLTDSDKFVLRRKRRQVLTKPDREKRKFLQHVDGRHAHTLAFRQRGRGAAVVWVTRMGTAKTRAVNRQDVWALKSKKDHMRN